MERLSAADWPQAGRQEGGSAAGVAPPRGSELRDISNQSSLGRVDISHLNIHIVRLSILS